MTATWMLHELARNPGVQQRLREEVLSVLGPTAVPTGKQLQELHYAKNIITETLRCADVRWCVFVHTCVLICMCVNASVYLCVHYSCATHCCRLHPIQVGFVRALDSPIILDGYEIPKGVSCVYVFI